MNENAQLSTVELSVDFFESTPEARALHENSANINPERALEIYHHATKVLDGIKQTGINTEIIQSVSKNALHIYVQYKIDHFQAKTDQLPLIDTLEASIELVNELSTFDLKIAEDFILNIKDPTAARLTRLVQYHNILQNQQITSEKRRYYQYQIPVIAKNLLETIQSVESDAFTELTSAYVYTLSQSYDVDPSLEQNLFRSIQNRIGDMNEGLQNTLTNKILEDVVNRKSSKFAFSAINFFNSQPDLISILNKYNSSRKQQIETLFELIPNHINNILRTIDTHSQRPYYANNFRYEYDQLSKITKLIQRGKSIEFAGIGSWDFTHKIFSMTSRSQIGETFLDMVKRDVGYNLLNRYKQQQLDRLKINPSVANNVVSNLVSILYSSFTSELISSYRAILFIEDSKTVGNYYSTLTERTLEIIEQSLDTLYLEHQKELSV